MTWYRTGTVAVTNGSPTVTGTGTAFVDEGLRAGQALQTDDGRTYEIASVVSNTSLTLATNYLGTTGSGKSYDIIPVPGPFVALAAAAQEMIDSFGAVRDGVGAGLHPDGTVSVPAIRFSSDQDTGIYRPGANSLGIVAGGAEQVRVISGGVGIGTTSWVGRLGVKATDESQIGLHVEIPGNAGSPAEWTAVRLNGNAQAVNQPVYLTWDWDSVLDGVAIAGVKESATAAHMRFYTMTGDVRTERMRLDSTGKLLLSDMAAVTYGQSVAPVAQINGTGAGYYGVSRWAANASSGGISFAKSRGAAVNTRGVVSSGDALGQLLFDGDDGTNFIPAASIVAEVDGTPGTNDMPGRLVFKTTADGASALSTRLTITNVGHIEPGGDNTQNFGSASKRLKELFCANNVINTSDEREKVWRGGMTEAELRAARRIIGELGFFQWKGAVEEKELDGARLHFGLRAQAVIRILMEEGVEHQQGIDFDPAVFVPDEQRPSFRNAFLCFDTWDEAFRKESITIPQSEEKLIEVDTGLVDDEGRPIVRIERHIEVKYVEVETGELILVQGAGNRFGVRIDQLALFLMAAQEAEIAAQASRQAELDARLAALEAAAA